MTRTETQPDAGFYTPGFKPAETHDLGRTSPGSARDEINLTRVLLRRMLAYLNDKDLEISLQDLEKIVRLLLRAVSAQAVLLRVQSSLDETGGELTEKEFLDLLDEER